MFTKSAQKLSYADLAAIESRISHALPEEFIEQYMEYNGGVPDKPSFYVEKIDTFVEVSFFVPIKYSSAQLGDSLIENFYDKLQEIGVPSKYLPFAVDWGGNFFSLDVETGDVVQLLMDLGEFSEKSVRFLTKGFDTFLTKLEETPEEEDV